MNHDLAQIIWYFFLRDTFAAIVGLAAGSLLTTTALRTLDETSLVIPRRSACPHCQHKLAPMDLIPILSFFMLRGKCRYCGVGISWYYPFVETFTAASFVVLVHMAQTPVQLVGMSIFVCTLIAVSITDFMRMEIPHEITYPSMLLGIIYSALTRQNGLQDALIGVGFCYILFDFIGFYGLKAYPFIKKYFAEEENGSVVGAVDCSIDQSYKQIQLSFENTTVTNDEEFVVMGAGDAVLAAVVAAWLGTQFLGLFIGLTFLAGAVSGVIYRAHDMYKQGKLQQCAKPCLTGIIVATIVVELLLILGTGAIPNVTLCMGFGIAAALCGSLIGITISADHKGPTQIPFGPPMAAGAVVAMLCMLVNHPTSFL